MLKKRAITYIILVPLVVLGILFLSDLVFAIVSGLVFLAALWEWAPLAGLQSKPQRISYLIGVSFITFIILFIVYWFKGLLMAAMPIIVFVFWIAALGFIIRYPKDAEFLKTRTVGMIAGFLTIAPAWVALNTLQYLHPFWVLYVMILIWAADTAAYFGGLFFAKHSLAPLVSPKKSWEGVIAALVATLFVALSGYWLLNLTAPLWIWLSLSVVTVAFSIVGDLFESLFKRLRNVKDSGTLLPGHGGILDRIDSLTAALPIFAIGFVLLS